MKGILELGPSGAFATVSALCAFLSPKRSAAFPPCRLSEVHTLTHSLDFLYLKINVLRYGLR
jgi:hypothetical protein